MFKYVAIFKILKIILFFYTFRTVYISEIIALTNLFELTINGNNTLSSASLSHTGIAATTMSKQSKLTYFRCDKLAEDHASATTSGRPRGAALGPVGGNGWCGVCVTLVFIRHSHYSGVLYGHRFVGILVGYRVRFVEHGEHCQRALYQRHVLHYDAGGGYVEVDAEVPCSPDVKAADLSRIVQVRDS